MKKIVLFGAASALALAVSGQMAAAADLPVFEPVVTPAPVIVEPLAPWTGFYIGAQVGYAAAGDPFDDDDVSQTVFFDTDGDGIPDDAVTYEADDDTDGFEAGVYIGADYQIGNFVIGALADINYIDIDGGMSATTARESVILSSAVDYYGTVRGRAGFAFGNILAYGHGGLAYSNLDMDTTTTFLVDADGDGVPDDADSDGMADTVTVSSEMDDDLFGYAVGGGIEALVGDRASIKLEYQYTDLDESDFENLFDDGSSSSAAVDFHTIRVGAAVRF